ncbi:N-acetylmuramic acid 6-phosphate etherase [Robiginitalea aurantiaca]|uniref:N-acetylmuramic acid 6-phosphate etherase n=1 Tax=Robiginitalea aurantiaca TaxID=3056915 RepID=A0ABT7WGN3_9FLAO|nr:N-acetylmuramic acid 6-phosphate etherase [Robiginitalea aurantiaca]MDM9632084.1 N-acetylmuramic acid 6-phosphate etherase [Robiginitalea aurantiaca]
MSDFIKITEQPSLHDNLEQLEVPELLDRINQEDQKVALAVRETLPAIGALVEAMEPRFLSGGRLFYIGAGTSGRLGILDASEIPPTYGMPHDRVIGLIAGGDRAIRKAVEHAEDDPEQAWKDLITHEINEMDTLVGIAASGTTPYVVGGIQMAREAGLLTAGITNNPGSPLALTAEIPIEIRVGPEFVTGSTRMKSGTSQKLALNMITTALMIRIGRVRGNKMVHMQLSNNKLIDRGTRYLVEHLGLSYEKAGEALARYGSVQKALEAYNS